MKFNLSDFLQLDTKGLLAVNGGYNCNGSTNNTVYPNTYYSGKGESPNGGGGTCPGKDGGTHIQPSDDGNGTGDDGTGGSGEGETETGGEELPDTVDGELTDGFSNDKSLYSKEGCLMTSVAKVLSQLTNTKITPLDINNKFDTNQDGLLSLDEIYDGLKLYLGNEYDIEDHWYEGSISKERFENAAIAGDTYVLARAYGDFDDNGTLEHHWVILEGYKTDAEGRMIFSYDGTSDNDSIKNRVYIFGDPHSKNEFKIDKIETFRFTNK